MMIGAGLLSEFRVMGIVLRAEAGSFMLVSVFTSSPARLYPSCSWTPLGWGLWTAICLAFTLLFDSL